MATPVDAPRRRVVQALLAVGHVDDRRSQRAERLLGALGTDRAHHRRHTRVDRAAPHPPPSPARHHAGARRDRRAHGPRARCGRRRSRALTRRPRTSGRTDRHGHRPTPWRRPRGCTGLVFRSEPTVQRPPRSLLVSTGRVERSGPPRRATPPRSDRDHRPRIVRRRGDRQCARRTRLRGPHRRTRTHRPQRNHVADRSARTGRAEPRRVRRQHRRSTNPVVGRSNR